MNNHQFIRTRYLITTIGKKNIYADNSVEYVKNIYKKMLKIDLEKELKMAKKTKKTVKKVKKVKVKKTAVKKAVKKPIKKVKQVNTSTSINNDGAVLVSPPVEEKVKNTDQSSKSKVSIDENGIVSVKTTE